MMTSFYNLLNYAATGIASPDMSYYDKMRASTLMGGATVQTLTGIPPISFKSDGTPLISWSMKGNGQQTGTPTPDNPVMPEFVGVRTGNLFDESTIEIGGLAASTGAEIADSNRRRSGFISVEPGTVYSLSREITSSGSYFWLLAYDENKNIVTDATASAEYRGALILGTTLTIRQWAFTTTPSTKYVRWYVTLNNSYKDIMLNIGSTALPYEPYGWAEKITCAGQTVPVYLGQTQTVRRIKKLVLDGTETWAVPSDHVFRLALDGYVRELGVIIAVSSHYIVTPNISSIVSWTTNERLTFLVSGSGNNYMYIRDSSYNSNADAFKAYLATQYTAGMPVTIWYVLATEQTAIVNEPLCKIGDYADELSSTDAAVTIPTVKGQNVLTVDTPIQPSEMTITYRG